MTRKERKKEPREENEGNIIGNGNERERRINELENICVSLCVCVCRMKESE